MLLRTRLSLARRRYLRKRTNENLRKYLILKGKSHIFDARMLNYYNVSGDVNADTKRFIARGYGEGLVPTSTTGGRHAPNSYHAQHRAADMGVRHEEVGTAKGLRRLKRFQRKEFWRARHGKTRPVELIGPTNNQVILRGRTVPLSEGSALENQHDNHVHGAF